jgi:hypothetical protein
MKMHANMMACVLVLLYAAPQRVEGVVGALVAPVAGSVARMALYQVVRTGSRFVLVRVVKPTMQAAVKMEVKSTLAKGTGYLPKAGQLDTVVMSLRAPVKTVKVPELNTVVAISGQMTTKATAGELVSIPRALGGGGAVAKGGSAGLDAAGSAAVKYTNLYPEAFKKPADAVKPLPFTIPTKTQVWDDVT